MAFGGRFAFTVRHDGRNWIAENEDLSARAPTLAQLDRRLTERLEETGRLAPCSRAELFMAFDDSTIPVWMRQYAQHYFHRLVRVSGSCFSPGSAPPADPRS